MSIHASASVLAGALMPVETIHFGGGLLLHNPATDQALIATEDHLFACDQYVPHSREGAVFVYQKHDGAWRFVQRLTDQIHPNSHAGWFGYAIEHGANAYGRWLAVESTWAYCTNASTQPGQTHGSGDIQMFKLNPSTGQWDFFQYVHPPAADELGNSFAISRDWMACGSLGHFFNSNSSDAYSGAAWFYQFDDAQWVLRQGPVLCSNGTNHWNFAYACEIEGANVFLCRKCSSAQHSAGSLLPGVNTACGLAMVPLALSREFAPVVRREAPGSTQSWREPRFVRGEGSS